MVPEAKSLEIKGDKCLFYQTHPVAHAGLKMDYVNNTLALNVLRGCVNHIELIHNDKQLHLQLNLGLMSEVYDLCHDSEMKPVTS